MNWSKAVRSCKHENSDVSMSIDCEPLSCSCRSACPLASCKTSICSRCSVISLSNRWRLSSECALVWFTSALSTCSWSRASRCSFRSRCTSASSRCLSSSSAQCPASDLSTSMVRRKTSASCSAARRSASSRSRCSASMWSCALSNAMESASRGWHLGEAASGSSVLLQASLGLAKLPMPPVPPPRRKGESARLSCEWRPLSPSLGKFSMEPPKPDGSSRSRSAWRCRSSLSKLDSDSRSRRRESGSSGLTASRILLHAK
mmetsp:Transcript_101102/g.240970  ORF Transcript_101102/g.240970 Transcript_101102/m.240970 type:complete len:260 (-) Transcript_101102:65-844(-)